MGVTKALNHAALIRGVPHLIGLGLLCLAVALTIGFPGIPTQAPDQSMPAESGLAAVGTGAFRPIELPGDLNPRKIALGQRLFHDPRLSGSGRLACASCHDIAANGASASPRAGGPDAQTVFNAVFSYRFGWEGKFRTLEAQALATLKGTMNRPGVASDHIYGRLRSDPDMVRAFDDIYRQAPSGETIANALAEYERTLVTPSRFDRWLKGDRGALTDVEQQGYETFVRLGCVACHQGRNVGGNLMQRRGIFRRVASRQPAIVRVPSLRNIAETAPYFQDGSAASLKSAIRRMASRQLNRDLSDEEIARLTAFLETLTGTYGGSPVRH
jgi:cytochrome c peroxidase